MINIEQKHKIESDFLINEPDALIAWSDSHDKITKIINDREYKIGVEIGIAWGGHSESILKNTDVTLLHGIDPYLHYNDYIKDGQCFEQTKMDNIYNFVKERLSYYNYRYNLIRDFSDNCLHLFEDNSLDFVYIDGNHFPEYVKRDVENWWKKVKIGGILSGHDYDHPVFPEITKIINSFCAEKNKKLEYLGTHVWCIYK